MLLIVSSPTNILLFYMSQTLIFVVFLLLLLRLNLIISRNFVLLFLLLLLHFSLRFLVFPLLHLLLLFHYSLFLFSFSCLIIFHSLRRFSSIFPFYSSLFCFPFSTAYFFFDSWRRDCMKIFLTLIINSDSKTFPSSVTLLTCIFSVLPTLRYERPQSYPKVTLIFLWGRRGENFYLKLYSLSCCCCFLKYSLIDYSRLVSFLNINKMAAQMSGIITVSRIGFEGKKWILRVTWVTSVQCIKESREGRPQSVPYKYTRPLTAVVIFMIRNSSFFCQAPGEKNDLGVTFLPSKCLRDGGLLSPGAFLPRRGNVSLITQREREEARLLVCGWGHQIHLAADARTWRTAAGFQGGKESSRLETTGIFSSNT